MVIACSDSFVWRPAPLHAFPLESRLVAGAEYFQRAGLAHRMRAAENPVLPCRKTAEDTCFHRLEGAEAQVCLHAGQRVGRQACALLEGDPDLVGPVELVG